MVSILQSRRAFGTGVEGIDWADLTIIIVFLSLALYNVIELLCIIWGTFKRYAGLYFWSFLIATIGIALSCIGFCIKYFGPTSLGYFSCTLSLMGWVFMVTGQSFVLWSRLHLVLRNRRRLKVIMWIIIFNGVVCHGMVIPLVYGSFSSNPAPFERPYEITEKIEIVVFFLQEAMLSGLYIYETVKLLRSGGTLGNKRSSRRLLKNLILVNILVIILDITILVLEFANLYDYQISYKPFAYSVKLKLEFTVLNRLVELTTGGRELNSSEQSGSSSGRSNSIASAVLETFNSNKSINGGSYHAYAKGGCHDNLHKPTPSEVENGNRVMMTTAITVHREKRVQDVEMRPKISSDDSASGSSKETSEGKEEKSASQINLAKNNGF
ncbi:hypothetical protein TARUN_2074 [Trichoderma arundinaceum]|uniref:DUF7703 domain-containing protein n=1 Tax=Trichoderma arundinaceum TaxID=490622 RepID=A0A395NVM4_TRIAR|nr:hypothetical protein TARUN_2074 [Trichoderma arundinaceum]